MEQKKTFQKYRHFSEKIAAIYIQYFLHHKLVTHNYRSVYGEIDLITTDKVRIWHATEVKWVGKNRFDPKVMITASKRARMEKSFLQFFNDYLSVKTQTAKTLKNQINPMPVYTLDLMILYEITKNKVEIEYLPNLLL